MAINPRIISSPGRASQTAHAIGSRLHKEGRAWYSASTLDTLSFIDSVISSLAWPTAAVVLGLSLRPAVSRVILGLRTVQWRGLQAEFGRELAAVNTLAEASSGLEPASLLTDDAGQSSSTNLIRLAELFPGAVVMEAWAELESTAREALTTPQESAERRPPYTETLGELLVDQGVLDETRFQIFTTLHNLYAQVSRQPRLELDPKDALDYARVARTLAANIISASKVASK